MKMGRIKFLNKYIIFQVVLTIPLHFILDMLAINAAGSLLFVAGFLLQNFYLKLSLLGCQNIIKYVRMDRKNRVNNYIIK